MSSLITKMTSSLKAHPKINHLAALLENPTDGSAGLAVAVGSQQSAMLTRNITRSFAITSLIIIWNAAKEYAQDGVFHDADPGYLDSLVDYPGFGAAMVASGWAAFDKKKKRITLASVSEHQKVVAAKKSPAARRQKEYRERLKIKKCLARDTTDGSAASCTNIVRPRERAVVIPRLVHEENGVTRFGSIVIEGVAYEVMTPPKSNRHSVKHDDLSVTKSIKDDVTRGITQCVTHSDSGVTHGITPGITVDGLSVTNSVTAGDVGVSRILPEPASAGASGLTQSVTEPVTHGDSGVTQGITEPVTPGGSDVTQGVTRSDPSGSRSRIPSRVIPSRAHTRFGFLRSEILKSKPKKTHTAREENSGPVDIFQTKIARCQSGQIHFGGTNPNLQRKRAGQAINQLSEQRFNAMFNLTQSLTLMRRGEEFICLTRKQASRPTTQQTLRSCPFPDAFPMHPGWKPSVDFLNTVQQIGIELKSEPDDSELTEFIGYWSAGQAEHTQQQWELKLGRCLAVGRRRGRKRYTAQRDITIMPSADYEIPEGFRGG